MQRCRQMSDIAREGVMFQSESSADKQYHAFAFRLDEIDFCPCVAFVMARNKEAKRLGLKDKGIPVAGLASDCKHLREIRRVTCQWTQGSEAEYRWDETCPKCGGPLVEEGTPMIPQGAGTDHVDDLKAMLAELKGSDTADAEMEATAAEITADAIDAELQSEQDEIDAVVQAAEDAVSTADEAPPVNRQHGTIPADPAEWIEDLIASRNGEIPAGDDWKSLRELWGPIYGKRNIDRAYKAAGTADAALARIAAPEEVIAELEDEYHGGPPELTVVRSGDEPDHAALEAEFQAAFAALNAAGLEHDADDPIAARYRAASDAVNHSNRSRDFAIATEQADTDEAERIHPSIPASVPTPPATARLMLDGEGIDVVVTRSAGADGAVLVMIQTAFEPDASDGGPGLRVLLNDEPIFAGKDYEPTDDDERDHAETLPGEPGYDTSYGDKIDQADAEATGPEAAAQRLAARINP